MNRSGRVVILLTGLVTVVLAGNPPRLSRGNFALEIRYEPIPGIPVQEAATKPLPLDGRPEMVAPAGTRSIGVVSQVAAEVLPVVGLRQLNHKQTAITETEPKSALNARDGFGVGAAATEPMTYGAVVGSEPDGLPNLFFYTPSGWDYPIVPSNVRNTHTVGPDLNDGDTTYFDFAVGNNGTATARPRFYTYLYNDGYVFAGFYTESLPAGYYTYYNDFPTMITAGSHLIAGFTDSTNAVVESLENDNRYSRSFTWRATGTALPNLVPYAPTGWDYPIVPSNVRNTHTVGPDLNDYDTTFIDFAILNNGNATARPRFYTYIYVDNRPISGWYVDSLRAGWYVYADDDPNMIPAGTHTLMVYADSTNAVTESNEGDNRYSRAFTWRHDPATLPNLVPYQPSGWPYPIIPSSQPGTRIVGPNLNDRDSTYIDYCWANIGNYIAAPRFYIYLYWETTPISGWYMESLPALSYVYVEDDAYILPAGTHALGLVVDSTNAVTESNEGDNRYSRSFTWEQVRMPDLTPYTPSGWDYPIVPSNIRNTHTVGPDLNDRDSTYLDWTVANFGSATAKPRFYCYLYLDGTPIAGFYLDSLLPLTYAYVADHPRMIAAGSHILMSYADSFNVVIESVETNNRYSRAFEWRHIVTAQPNLIPYAPSGWDYPIVPSNIRNTHTVGPNLNDEDTTFVDFAFANIGQATARPGFYVFLYVDSMPFVSAYVESLPGLYYATVNDFPYFFGYGNHELMMLVDSFNVVAESSESDNRWTHTFFWEHYTALSESRSLKCPPALSVLANPFVEQLAVKFSLPAPATVTLSLYDASGGLVSRLLNEQLPEGVHPRFWDLRKLRPGSYFLELRSGAGNVERSRIVKLTQ